MRPLLLLLSLAAFSAPALAESGLINAAGSVNSTCTVNDLTLALALDGPNTMKANGLLPMAQTGTTKWTLSQTDRVSGRDYTVQLNLRGFGGLDLVSTQSAGDEGTVTGFRQGSASIDVVLTDGTGFEPGLYQTHTTVTCTTQAVANPR